MHIPVLEITTRLVFIHPGEDIRPTRHTNCSCVIVPIKDQSVRRQLVHIRSHNILVAIGAHRVGALVIGEEENDIGPFLLRPK